MKPYSESCEQNKDPILAVLQIEFAACKHTLEIGSGTGQHAVFFGRKLPHLIWQTSDVREHHQGINAWLCEANLLNVIAPVALNVSCDPWPQQRFDSVFSANTSHIMRWQDVQAMFTGVGAILDAGGVFCLYGPFNYHQQFTSESNARFDQWLKSQHLHQGIRNFEDLLQLAAQNALALKQDYEMPANNRILVWKKS